MTSIAMHLQSRQDNNSGYYGGGLDGTGNGSGNDTAPADGSGYWSQESMSIRYAIVTALAAAIILFFVGGHYHATRRLRQGKPPLGYHAWMVRPRRRRWGYDPHGGYGYGGYGGGGYPPHGQGPPGSELYPMQTYGPPGQHQRGDSYPLPPPPYQPPPVYQPPEGASKVLADQEYGRRTEAAAAATAAAGASGAAAATGAAAGPAAPAPAHAQPRPGAQP